MHNVVSFLYYTAGSCIFNDDLDSILYVRLLIVYSVGSGVVSPKLCNFGNLKLRWRLHQSHNMVASISVSNLLLQAPDMAQPTTVMSQWTHSKNSKHHLVPTSFPQLAFLLASRMWRSS